MEGEIMSDIKNQFANEEKGVECKNINCVFMSRKNRVVSDFPISACYYCMDLIYSNEGELDYFSEENE